MALLVIVCGALMMIGGAISLLMGFDIVMTERGSAMTLGGVIALSGGLIALGIGFALLRLSQILAALELRNPRGASRAATPERPVVPIGGQAAGDMPDVPVVPEPSTRLPGALAVGTGIAAAGMAGGLALARTGTSPDGPAVADVAAPPGPHGGPPPFGTALPEPENAPSPPPQSLPDLEEELSRALAETDAGLPGERTVSVGPDDRAFSDGLTDLLARPKGKKRKFEPDAPPVPADAPVAEATLPLVALPLAEEIAAPAVAVPPPYLGFAPVTIPDVVEGAPPGPIAVDDKTQEETAPDLAAMPQETPTGAPPVSGEDPAMPVDNPTMDDRPSDDDLAVVPISRSMLSRSMTALSASENKVLGTYNAGGRTYSMFADGSVQAVTESGVERFGSMDELRRHLAATGKSN